MIAWKYKGNHFKTNIEPIFLPQKKDVRTPNKTDYYEPTNLLFISLHTQKLYDLVDLNAAVI